MLLSCHESLSLAISILYSWDSWGIHPLMTQDRDEARHAIERPYFLSKEIYLPFQ